MNAIFQGFEKITSQPCKKPAYILRTDAEIDRMEREIEEARRGYPVKCVHSTREVAYIIDQDSAEGLHTV